LVDQDFTGSKGHPSTADPGQVGQVAHQGSRSGASVGIRFSRECLVRSESGVLRVTCL
jgi:hypothetical protein